jgi:hypothetical protein
MRDSPCWLVVITLLASCSSSSSGGGGGSGGATASQTVTASGTDGGGTGGFGGAPAELSSHGAVLLTWKYLQGDFDSVGQEPIYEGEAVPPTPRRLVGCAVDAPELGERVLYLERAAVEVDAVPDRQLLIVLGDEESSGPGGSFSSAVVRRLASPGDWAGGCVVGATMALRGEVAIDDACGDVHLTRGETGTVSVSVAPMPARCASGALDAAEVNVDMWLDADQIDWRDELTAADGTESYDPPVDGSSYQLVRRSP